MLLSPQDGQLFFRLHGTLMAFVNQRRAVIPDALAGPEAYAALAPESQLKVRDALPTHIDLIASFVEHNPFRLGNDELEIVRSWRHLVAGNFYVFRELAKHTVFLSDGGPPIAYGVLSLTRPMDDLVGPHLPVLVKAVLLPFQGKIVYDGLLSAYRISFGPGIRRRLNNAFKEAKARHGIVTSLPISSEPAPSKPRAREQRS
jgi:hypothetical protein